MDNNIFGNKVIAAFVTVVLILGLAAFLYLGRETGAPLKKVNNPDASNKVNKIQAVNTVTPDIVISNAENAEKNFTAFLQKQPKHISSKYLVLNNLYFNALEFTNNTEYQNWLAEGFPSPADISFCEQYSTTELSKALIKHVDYMSLNDLITQNPKLNRNAILAINFANAVAEVQEAIQYYVPEYQLGDPLPHELWPNGQTPEIVLEKYENLNYAQAATRPNSAIGALVKAKFDFIVPAEDTNSRLYLSNSSLGYLVKAQRKLAGNQVTNYIKNQYPAQYEEFLKQRL